MIYKSASSMRLTRNCLALATSSAAVPTGLLQTKVTFINGNQSIINLLTGIVTVYSCYRNHQRHNKVDDDPKSYVYTPVYFDDPNNYDNNNSLYRHGKVHILNVALSAYHRDLFYTALQRAAIQNDCDLADAKLEIHHIDRNRKNNSIYNLLPITGKEHNKIHNALRHGASTYEALVAGLGEALVHSIFGVDYFNFGDSSVFTSKIHGVPYIQHILSQLSTAQYHAHTKELKVRCLNGRYEFISIEGMSIYELLSALYLKSAVEVVKPTYSTSIAI